MKKSLLLSIVMLLFTSTLLPSCSSNEKNYREAYDKAMEKRKTIGAETYAKIEAEQKRNTAVINGDSVRILYYNVNVAIDSTDQAQTYSVIVASFSQRINARSYRDRLRNECSLPSYVLYGGPEKKYYVVARGFDDVQSAAAFLHDITDKVKIKIIEPKPWILRKI